MELLIQIYTHTQRTHTYIFIDRYVYVLWLLITTVYFKSNFISLNATIKVRAQSVSEQFLLEKKSNVYKT